MSYVPFFDPVVQINLNSNCNKKMNYKKIQGKFNYQKYIKFIAVAPLFVKILIKFFKNI